MNGGGGFLPGRWPRSTWDFRRTDGGLNRFGNISIPKTFKAL